MRRLRASFLFRLGLLVLLSGCAAKPSVVSETLSAVWKQSFSDELLGAKVDLRYRYLRVEVQGGPLAIYVLAFIDKDPAGPIETWFSAKREVIKIQNGRIVGTSGLAIDWVSVRFPAVPPQWSDISSSPIAYVRERDLVPGYAFGLRDSMEVAPLQEIPSRRLPETLPMDVAQGYQWFQAIGHTSAGNTLPVEIFAWGRHRGGQTIVYSEQCLAPEYCLKLQRWPVLP